MENSSSIGFCSEYLVCTIESHSDNKVTNRMGDILEKLKVTVLNNTQFGMRISYSSTWNVTQKLTCLCMWPPTGWRLGKLDLWYYGPVNRSWVCFEGDSYFKIRLYLVYFIYWNSNKSYQTFLSSQIKSFLSFLGSYYPHHDGLYPLKRWVKIKISLSSIKFLLSTLFL